MTRLVFFSAALALCTAACTVDSVDLEKPVASRVFDRNADEVRRLPALRAPVEVARDRFGIPHFYAENLHDLMLVQGYVVARDRFWAMDVFRRLAKGQLSTLVGAIPVLLDLDIFYRSLQLTDDGAMVYDRIYEAMEPAAREAADAYAAGVNLYLDHAATGRYGVELPPEYNELLLGLLFQPSALDIPRWDPADSIAIGRLQQWMLSGANIDRELLIGKLAAELDPTLFSHIVRMQPAVTAATLADWPGLSNSVAQAPGGSPRASYDGAIAHYKALRESFPLLFWSDNGSNNWVIGPERSESGYVLVANDPHLIMTNPPMFYQAHFNTAELEGEDRWNAYGVVFPGIPVFMIAHTDRIAWGVTVLGYDVMDVYHETVVDGGAAVLRGSQKIPVKYSTQKFCHGYGDDCIVRDLAYVPGHGPRVAGEDEFLTFRWTGREPTQDFDAFRGLMVAQNVDEALETIDAFRVGAQSFVIGDVEGNIAYYGPANVPVRDERCPQPPYVPLDGASGHCEWTGYLSSDQLPRAVNPAQGYLATANNDIVGTTFDNDVTSDANYYWMTRDAGFRMGRLRQLLDAKEKFNKRDMERIAADVYSLEGSLLAPHIVKAGHDAPGLGVSVRSDVKEALTYLERWTYETAIGVEEPFTGKAPTPQQVIDSVATSIYYTWNRLLKERLVGDELARVGVKPPSESDGYEPIGTARIALNALTDPAAAGLWDDVSTESVTETKESVMLGVLEEAVDWLTHRFGTGDQREWNWGKIHILRIFDPYGFLGADMRALGPYPNDGALGTLDAATPLFLFGNYVQVGGPQMRMVTELNPMDIRSWNSLPGGQVHDRASPYYDNLLPYFVGNTTYTVPFTSHDVAAATDRLTVFLAE